MKIPKPQMDSGNDELNPFLKVKDIGNGKVGALATVALTGHVRAQRSQFGKDQLIVEVLHNKHTYDWGVTLDTPNHRELFDRFGNNPNKWKGKIGLTVNPAIRKGANPYVAVARAAATRAFPRSTRKAATRARKGK